MPNFSFTLALVFSIGVDIALLVAIWRTREYTPLTIAFSACVAIAVSWALSALLEQFTNDLQLKIWISRWRISVNAFINVAWFAVTIYYTGRRLTRTQLALICIVPIITVVFTLTEDFHTFARYQIQLDTNTLPPTLVWRDGVWRFVNILYTYGLAIAIYILMLRSMVGAHPVYQRQTSLIIFASIATSLFDALYNFFGISPVAGYNFAPATLVINGGILAWAIFRHRLFDLMPTARAALIETLTDGVIVIDIQNRIIDINRAAQTMMNLPEKSPIGQPIAEVLAKWGNLVKEFENISEIKTELQVSEKTPYYISMTISPIKDQSANLVGRLIVFRNITENKQVEITLRKSEERLRSFFEKVPDAVIICNEIGRIVFINHQAELLFQYTREEMSQITIEALLPESIRHKHLEHRQKYNLNPVTRQMNNNLRFKALRKNNTEFLAEIMISPIENIEETLIVCVVRDITERNQIERLRDDLIHTMVHDLRNPLANIQTALELMGTDDVSLLSEEEQKTLMQTASLSVSNMVNLVNSILDVHRLENGEMPLKLIPTSLFALINSTLHTQLPLTKQKSMSLTSDVMPSLPNAIIDPDLIERVLQNIVGNAIKFTPQQGSIHVAAKEYDKNFICISVSNTGEGITPEIQNRLFQKFVSGKQKGHGSGLGLAFCKLVVEAHGGKIWVESKDGQSTTFYFTLPIEK